MYERVDAIKEKILLIMKKHVNDVEIITENSVMNELYIDSIDFVKIVIDIENECEVSFDNDSLDVKKFMCVNDIIRYVKNIK